MALPSWKPRVADVLSLNTTNKGDAAVLEAATVLPDLSAGKEELNPKSAALPEQSSNCGLFSCLFASPGRPVLTGLVQAKFKPLVVKTDHPHEAHSEALSSGVHVRNSESWSVHGSSSKTDIFTLFSWLSYRQSRQRSGE